MPADHQTFKDLDKERIFSLVQQGIRANRLPASFSRLSAKQILSKLNLLIEGDITNAAIVLFGRNTQGFYPQCLVRMARFRSKEKTNLFEIQHAYGNAFTLIEAVELFANRHLPIISHFEGMRRIDTPLFPVKALREVIVNALCHREYANIGGSISFFIYDDRIEVVSFGKLPLGIEAKDLKCFHESVPRNPTITDAFYRGGIIEKSGMGTLEIIKECKNIKQLEPDFFERGSAFVVSLRSKVLIGNIGDLVEVGCGKNNELSSLQIEILDLLKKNTYLTVEQLSFTLLSPPSIRTIKRALLALKILGFIKTEGKARKARWVMNEDEKRNI